MRLGGREIYNPGAHNPGGEVFNNSLWLEARCIKSVGFASLNKKSRLILEGSTGILNVRDSAATWHYRLTLSEIKAFNRASSTSGYLYSSSFQDRIWASAQTFSLKYAQMKRRLHVWWFKTMCWELVFYEISIWDEIIDEALRREQEPGS